MTEYAVTHDQLTQRLALPLDLKIKMSLHRLRMFNREMKGEMYTAFSGGKDSLVVKHLVEQLYPDTPGLFNDTGLEFPEIREFVRTFDNIEWWRPKMTYPQVLDGYGYPVISKEVAMAISRYRNTKNPDQKDYRLWGKVVDGKKYRRGVIPNKWHYMVDAPFKISDECCHIMKINPAKQYHKKTGLAPILGTMAVDSRNRKMNYMRFGCNNYDYKIPQCRPISFWTQEDVWAYIKKFKIPYSAIYDMGELHTGCTFCMFGVQYEPEPNRFQRMAFHHPKLYNHCINKLGCGKVMNFMGVPY